MNTNDLTGAFSEKQLKLIAIRLMQNQATIETQQEPSISVLHFGMPVTPGRALHSSTRRICFVKALRAVTGCGLSEAKTAVLFADTAMMGEE